MKASLLASAQLRTGRGRGGSVSLADGSGDEGADGSALEAAESFAEPGGSVAAAEGSLAAAAIGKASELSAPPRPCPPRHRPQGRPRGRGGKQNLSAYIWSVADLLRGDYKQSDYGKVILPFTVLRRLDCVLEPSNIWILSNRKPTERKGKVQLIDASSFWQKMCKRLGSKRKELSPEHIAEITRLFGNFEAAEQDGKPISRIFRTEDFGYRTITV